MWLMNPFAGGNVYGMAKNSIRLLGVKPDLTPFGAGASESVRSELR